MLRVTPYRDHSRNGRFCWQSILGLVALLLAIVAAQGLAQSQVPSQTLQQTVEGVGVIVQQNQAEARQKALSECWRKALEQTIANLLDTDVLVTNLSIVQKQVYARAPQYIHSYRILWEYPDMGQQVYRIALEVEVAVETLHATLEALGLTSFGVPRLLLLITIPQPAAGGVSIDAQRLMTEALRSQLQAYHFRLVDRDTAPPWDGRDAAALDVGRAAAADVVLIGRVDIQRTHNGVAGMPLQTVQATAQISIWVTATGERLTFDRAQATVDHRDAILAGEQALQKAIAELRVRLEPVLQVYQQSYTRRAERRARGL